MKKTLTINLNNAVFHIDEDAYELLRAYLNEVSNHLKNESEKAEIMADIEARIAELFSEKMDKQKHVITIEDVNDIMTTMGTPNQFLDSSATEESNDYQKNEQSYGSESIGQKRKSKKYYRDADNQLLGGVCAGLAAYMNWDIAFIRIIFVVLAFITSGTFVLIYLLTWLIAPKAETTAQKLEMQGEDVNIETIKNKMTDAKEYLSSDKFKKSASEVVNRGSGILLVGVKIIVTFLIVTIGIAGVTLIAGLIFGLIVFLLEPNAIISVSPEFFDLFFADASPDRIILLIISMLLIIGCPLFTLIYWATNALSKNRQRRRSSTVFWIMLILWLGGIFTFAYQGAETIKHLKTNGVNIRNWYYDEITDNAIYRMENRILPPFKSIDASGAVHIELVQQNRQTVSLETLSAYLSNVKTEVANGTLRIYSTERLIHPNIKVRIGIDSLENIAISGASKVDFETPFKVNNLSVRLSGASKLDLKLISAQKLDIKLNGASKADVSGMTDTLLIACSGASKIDTEELSAKITNVETNGASNAEVRAIDEFEGKAHGASKITCYGNPIRKVEKTSASSSIRYK